VVRIDRVTQAKSIGEQRGSEQNRLLAKRDQRPDPCQNVRDDRNGEDPGCLQARIRRIVVERAPDFPRHAALIYWRPR
jgi:hypothetical protein